MALSFTKPITLGFKAPGFLLPDAVSGKMTSYQDIQGKKGTLVMFICNHCPYVQHVVHELVQLGKDYIPKGIGMVAISVNDVAAYPEDHPEKMKALAQKLDFPFPYLFDESQESARLYDAVCTPDFDLFNAENRCVYRGQLDGARPGNNIPVTGKEMRKALEQLLAGEQIPEEQIPSAGCSIKWK